MSQEMEYAPFEKAPANGNGGATANDLGRLSDVPVELAVEIGRTRMTVGETLELRPGSIVVLNRTAGEPVDLLVNGTPIARGEVVVIDEEFGLRITDVLGDETAADPAPENGAPADGTATPVEAPGTV
jgi:flagellar motor switch protein FliN/FliY